MKKFVTVFLSAALLISAFAVSASAAGKTMMFTDFDTLVRFEEGVDIVDNGDVTEDTFKDYYGNAYDWTSAIESKVKLEIADGKGEGGTKALAITKSDVKENAWVELYGTSANNISDNYAGAKYLLVWADFTDVEFRKACFGVIADDGYHTLYRTDEIDARTDLEFYLYKNGEWVTCYHGYDGCFGADQDSPINGFVGYMAFPLADFMSWDSADNLFDADTTKVEGVFFYFDVASDDYLDKTFYFDNIAFVEDYKSFDATVFTAGEGETSTGETSTGETSTGEVSENETSDTSEEDSEGTPVLGDGSLTIILVCAAAAVAAVVIAVVLVVKKKHA